MDTRPARCPDAPDQGQVTVLMAVALVVFVVALVALGHIAAGVADRARAQRAADAAALAAAVRPDPDDARRVAAHVADANRASLARIRWVDGTVVVTVRVARVDATAAARPSTR